MCVTGGAEKNTAHCARRSLGEATGDGGSIPPTSTARRRPRDHPVTGPSSSPGADRRAVGLLFVAVSWWGLRVTWFGWASVDAAIDLARDAALLGWAATALFCAVAGIAIALWSGVRWWLGLLLGALGLYGGLLLLLCVGGVRAGKRVRDARAATRATTGVSLPSAPPPAPVLGAPTPTFPAAAAVAPPGFRANVRRGWRWWTRTPPSPTEWGVAVLAVLVAGALIAATQVTWLTLSATGRTVTGVGPFEIQLGLFVVLSALAALVCAAGILRWRSAWWPVLLAWFATWWAFVAVEVLRVEGALDALNRLLGDQARERIGYDVRPEIDLGVGWSVMVVLAAAMMVLAVVLLVLQGRRTSHYRAIAPS